MTEVTYGNVWSCNDVAVKLTKTIKRLLLKAEHPVFRDRVERHLVSGAFASVAAIATKAV